MNKIVIIAVFIFWVAVSFFYANTLVKQNTAGNNLASLGNNNYTPVNKNTDNGSADILNAALVAQHNTSADCWVTANGNVYSVSSYLRAHPGGASAITPYCGADIAAAFAAQGHSSNAASIMASYKIGTLGSTVDNNTVTSVDNNPAPSGGGESEDDDDEEEDDD